MPEGKGAHGPSGPINQPSPRSGVHLGNGRGSGPGLTSSSAFGSVAQGPAGQVGHRPTRGPWNTAGPQGQGYAAKAPWGDGVDLSGAGRDQTGGWQSDQNNRDKEKQEGGCQAPNHRDKEKQTGGVSACPTPPVCKSGVAAHQPIETRRAAHKPQDDHDPKPRQRLRRRQGAAIGSGRIAAQGAGRKPVCRL